MEMPEVIRSRRAQLGLSQAQLAAAAGVDRRQIRRYESGEQQPALNIAVAIANALEISVSELAGQVSQRVDLTGDWWASWQTYKEREEIVTAQEVRVRAQTETTYELRTLTRGIDVDEGGYMWRGELRLWDNEILMGWYVAEEGAVRSKGTLYFTLHPHGIDLRGRWVGLSYDGAVVTGWGAMARNEADARQLIDTLNTEAA
jgi:transcriptional regulator with XRE-family HTH domain